MTDTSAHMRKLNIPQIKSPGDLLDIKKNVLLQSNYILNKMTKAKQISYFRISQVFSTEDNEAQSGNMGNGGAVCRSVGNN